MRRFLPLTLAAGMLIGIAGPVAAAPKNDTAQGAIQNALIGVIVQAAVQDVEVVTLRDSLNNLLQNADIDVNVLNDSLNNVLQNVNVDIDNIEVLSPDGDTFLNVQILSGGVNVTLP